jgi:hypothetical protein
MYLPRILLAMIMKTNIAGFAKKSFFTAAKFGAAAFVGSHAGNFILNTGAPTPLDFAHQQGIAYSSETETLLRKFDETKVLEKGGIAEKAYKVINWPLYFTLSSSSDKAASHLTPGLAARILGAKPVIIAPPLKTGAVSQMIANDYGKETRLAGNIDQIDFSYSLFHELGHEDIHRDLGAAAQAIPSILLELSCDRFALSQLVPEYGPTVRKYVTALRATNVFSSKYDVSLGLARKEDENPKNEISRIFNEHESWEGFSRLVRGCLNTASPANDTQEHDPFDKAYACLKKYQQDSAADPPSDMTRRAAGFIAGYEFLFHKPN